MKKKTETRTPENKAIPIPFNVVQLAVKHELSNWEKAKTFAMACGLGDNYEEILFQFCTLNTCTLVQHAVSPHYDSFGTENLKKVYSLENKIGFASNNFHQVYGMGRGGNGACSFVFCLLDWGRPARQRRRQFVQQYNEFINNNQVNQAEELVNNYRQQVLRFHPVS